MRGSAIAGQIIRFGGLTLLSASVSLGLPLVLHEVLGLNERLAFAIALTCAFLMNFVGIRGFVFGKRGGISGDLARFIAASLAFRGFEYVGFLLLFDGLELAYPIAMFVPLFISFCLKFGTYKLFVFAERSPRHSRR